MSGPPGSGTRGGSVLSSSNARAPRSTVLTVAVLAFALTSFALGALSLVLIRERTATMDAARAAAVRLAGHVADSLGFILVIADAEALDAQARFTWQVSAPSMQAELDRIVASMPDLTALQIRDTWGRTRVASRVSPEGVTRDWVDMALTSHRDTWIEPLVSPPGDLGLGQDVLAVSRGGWGDDGAFMGFTTAFVSLTRLREEVGIDPLQASMRLTVLMPDGQVLSTFDGRDATDFPQSQWLTNRELLAVLESKGSLGDVASGEAVIRTHGVLVGAKAARDFPITAFVQVPERVILEDWNAYVRWAASAAGGLLLAVIGLLVLYMLEDRRRRADAMRLRESEDRLSLALENSGMGMWDWALDTNRVIYNDRQLTMLGYDPGDWEPVHESWSSRVHPEDWDRVFSALNSHLEGRTDGYEVEHRLRRKDGCWQWVAGKGRVIARDAAGKALRIIGTHTDIDATKRDEAVLREKSARLEESNKDLEQFAYVASHDLQEPLRMVSAYLGLLRRRYGQTLNGEALEFMAFAEEGAKRMSHLILDLLEYSRVTTRAGPTVVFDSWPVIQEALQNLSVAVQEANAHVSVDVPHAFLSGDRSQLLRLFQNLIGNAVKYSDSKRKPVITVHGFVSGDKVVWAVSDNGIGFDPVHADRIFMIFQRLHTRDKYEGTGIGLAVCKRIVERHGGTIVADGAPGRGSVFTVTLPLTDMPAEDDGESDGDGAPVYRRPPAPCAPVTPAPVS